MSTQLQEPGGFFLSHSLRASCWNGNNDFFQQAYRISVFLTSYSHWWCDSHFIIYWFMPFSTRLATSSCFNEKYNTTNWIVQIYSTNPIECFLMPLHLSWYIASQASSLSAAHLLTNQKKSIHRHCEILMRFSKLFAIMKSLITCIFSSCASTQLFVSLFVLTADLHSFFAACQASTTLSHVSSEQTNRGPFKAINYTLETNSSSPPSSSSFDPGMATVTLEAGGSSLDPSVQNHLTISHQYIEPS